MKFEGIIGNNIELTPEIEKYMRTRIQKLSKIVQNMEPATMRAEVSGPSLHRGKGKNDFSVGLTAKIQDKDFHARATNPNVYKAIEKVRSDMYQQITRWKNKERGAQRKKQMMIKKLLRSAPDAD